LRQFSFRIILRNFVVEKPKFYLAFDLIGGYDNLVPLYKEAIPAIRPENTSCGLPREDFFNVFRDPINGDLPWPGMVFGITINALWYWCTDQVKIQ